MGSLALAEPSFGGHRRKPSNATFTSNEGTVADHGEPAPESINLTPLKSRGDESATLHSPNPDRTSHDKSHLDPADAATQDPSSTKVSLTEDEDVDLGAFDHRPNKLAGLVDPKSLDTLTKMGGVQGLLRSLGTHRTRGLGIQASKAEKEEGHHVEGDVPGIVVTSPGGENSTDEPDKPHPAASATLEDRRRVYGENVLPSRPSKSLLQLMWLALQDKVLVSYSGFIALH
jgi:P-type Ca2+ transporter type 2C